MLGIRTSVSRRSAPIQLEAVTRSLALLVVLAALTTAGALSSAQTFTVLHTFTGGADGAYPGTYLTLDSHGNLYGTAAFGGMSGGQCYQGCGTVYEQTQVNGSWSFNLLYSFTDRSDGVGPSYGVTLGPNGTLFGTASDTLFNLHPPAHTCGNLFCPWNETTLGSAGLGAVGSVVFDSQGNLYGTTQDGGAYFKGTVYKAARSGATWSVSVIYSFGAPGDGEWPIAGVVVDSAGKLYGTTPSGGTYNQGTVFELSPSGGSWTETILHSFTGGSDGCNPWNAGLVFDRNGNLYGGAIGDNCGATGTIFELSPEGGGWNFPTIYTGPRPPFTMAIDSAGNLYGISGNDGTCSGLGCVFELSPSASGWRYTNLYNFTDGNDGRYPGGVTVTGPGEYLYGTAYEGGTYDVGTIYQISLEDRR
jgi:uncharacterized repeat protein (TIGR03803 family)